MALTEEQIQRYSRQILLAEVGGRGQRRLLGARVELEGASPALDVAAAYLAASGTPLLEAPPGARAGFLHDTPLVTFAADAGLEAPVGGWIGPLERAPASLERFRVAVTDHGLVAAPAGALLPAPGVDAGPAVEPVTLGALAALVVQRYVLGLESAPLVVGFDGQWRRLS